MSGEHNRRDFLKYLGGAAGAAFLATKAGKVAAAVPGPSSVANDSDYPIINTSNDLENITVREVRDASMTSSYVNVPILGYFNDDVGNAANWELIDSSIPELNPLVSGSSLIADAPSSDLAEQFYTVDYRGRNPGNFDKPAGMTHTIEDQIDRYKTDLTITYVEDGNTKTKTINIPNVVAKQIFGWNPDEAIPLYSLYGFDRVNNPAEFEDAMNNLYQVLNDEGLEDSIIKNRNTPLPPLPSPNPWLETRELLKDLGEDPMTVDNLYPTVINVEMTDYTK